MDLVSRVQRLPLGRFHYRLLVVTGLGWMFDAMDTGLIAFIMPRLSQSWQLTAPEKAWVVSIGFVGMAIGAVLAGGIADRIDLLSASVSVVNCRLLSVSSVNMYRRAYAGVSSFCWKASGDWAGYLPRWSHFLSFRLMAGK